MKEIVKNIDKNGYNLLEIGHKNNRYYKLNQAIETVIKKVEFVDRFNFETV